MNRRIRSAGIIGLSAAIVFSMGISVSASGTDFRFITSMSDVNRTEVLDYIVGKLQEKYPDVNFSNESGEDYNNKAKLGFSSGSGYDLVFTDDLGLTALRDAGYLLDLSEYAEERDWIGRQQEGATDFYNQRTPGEMYTIGMNYAPIIVYYNKDIFEELKLEIPTTLSEFENVMKAATENGYIGAENCKDNQNGWFIQSMVQNKAPFEDILDWYYLENSSENIKNAFIESAETVKSWADAGYFRTGWEGIDYGDVAVLFGQGKSAMSIDGNWMINDYESTGLNVGVFAFPGVEDSSQENVIINPVDAAFAVGKQADETQLAVAVDFIDIALSEEVGTMWLERGSLPSVAGDYSSAEVSDLTKELLTAIEGTKSGFYLDNVKPGFLDLFIKETQLYLLGDQTSGDMWDSIDKFWHES